MQSEKIYEETEPVIKIKPIDTIVQEQLMNITPLPTNGQENLIKQTTTTESTVQTDPFLGIPSIVKSSEQNQSEGMEQSKVWEKENPPKTDQGREEKLSEKFESSESPEQLRQSKSDSSTKEYMEEIKSKIDENAQKELPSYSPQRGSQVGIDYQREFKAEPKEEERKLPDLNMREKEPAETKPESLPTMDQERDSTIDRETKWQHEHGMEPEVPRSPNPDIKSEFETPRQHRPSVSDEEEEKKSYSSQSSEETPKLYEGREEKESFRPAEKEETITKLQKSLEDRDQPTFVHPSGESAQQTEQKPPVPSTEETEKVSEEMKEKFGKLKIDIKERHDEHAKQSLLGASQEEKIEAPRHVTPTDKFDLQEVINYLNENKNIIEESLSESDKKKIQVILNVAKDFKSLCEEALDALKEDLLGFYNIGKTKFAKAMSEIKAAKAESAKAKY